MFSQPLKVAVVGCGTAGPAAALFLKRQGHDVVVFERSTDLGPVGAGILIQPTGMAVLEKLRLLDGAVKKGAPIHRLYGHLPQGHTVMDLYYGNLKKGLFGLGLHRGVLFDVLYQALKGENIPVHLGVTQESYQKRPDGKYLLTDEHNHEHGPFDMIIVADGARSKLRRNFSGLRKEKPYPWGALWAILEKTVPDYDDVLYQVYEGTQTMLGFLPTGRLSEGGKPLVSVFWSIDLKEMEAWKREGLNPWKKKIASLAPTMAPLLEQIASPDQLILATYMDVVMKRWHDGSGLVFLGDAGHAMSPQLGQGANIALMDAMALDAAFKEKPTLPEALQYWFGLRKRHIRYYQLASRWLTPFFQSDYNALKFLRDPFMGPLCKVEPFRHLMLASMAGIKTGFFTEQEMERP